MRMLHEHRTTVSVYTCIYMYIAPRVMHFSAFIYLVFTGPVYKVHTNALHVRTCLVTFLIPQIGTFLCEVLSWH